MSNEQPRTTRDLIALRRGSLTLASGGSVVLERDDLLPDGLHLAMCAVALHGEVTHIGQLLAVTLNGKGGSSVILVDCERIEAVTLPVTLADLELITGEALALCRRNFLRARNLQKAA
ncbi:MAG: hypothetical protein HC933_03800 [Pleurocapsa sp. SU_196_0]|nr:hypothetical protein [Pleurocapsa sp. SU_196_0]